MRTMLRDGLTRRHTTFEGNRARRSSPVGFFVKQGLQMQLDYSKINGMVAAVIQDWKSGRVLMVGFMNEEAFHKTVETGCAVFYSRSRNKLWLKGETSGHKLMVKEISTDCDRDAVLLKVEAIGPGVCHEGYESCFFRKLEGSEWKVSEGQTYDPKAVY